MKKNEKYYLDVNNIPKLENENDAYYIDRDHNVGVLKFIDEELSEFAHHDYEGGKSFCPRYYAVLGKNEVLKAKPYYHDGPFLVKYGDGKLIKDEGCFAIVSDNKKSYEKYIFVPSKKNLIRLFKEANRYEARKTAYVIDIVNISCFKEKRSVSVLKKEYGSKNIIISFDENEILNKFEDIKRELYNKLDDYIKSATKLLESNKRMLIGHEEERDYEILSGELKQGDSFVSKNQPNKRYTVSHIDRYGLIHLKGGGVIGTDTYVLPCDNIKYLDDDIKKYNKLRRHNELLSRFIKSTQDRKKRLNEYTPLLNENAYVFKVSWLEKEYNEAMKPNYYYL